MNLINDEKDFQQHIIDSLVSNGGYIERKPSEYNKLLAMDVGMLSEFLHRTQPEAMAKLEKIYGGKAMDTVTAAINQAACQKCGSLIDTLKNGVEVQGITDSLKLLYNKPASSLMPAALARYSANIPSVMKEVYIDAENTQRLDLVIFMNGLAIMTFELKCQAKGQDYRNAIYQYSYERDCGNRLLMPKAGALVHFAMDLSDCFMTTKLDGDKTRFIPFNRGSGSGVNAGAGNPEDDGCDDYPTHYVWDDVLTKDSVIELLTKFIFVQKKETFNEATGKKEMKETVIFPRYHQRDAVHKLLEDVYRNGSAMNYLIQHSAGSGKTNTISWLAHRLASLHDANDDIIFNNVVIVTDRIVVDRQLQSAVKAIDHQSGLIKTIDDSCDSSDLSEALKGNTKIIVTTIQKFLYIDFCKMAQKLKDKKFAVIIDEAHSSTSGKDLKALSNTLGSGDPGDVHDAQDAIEDELRTNGKQENVSMFAFTATPKATTLALFGTPAPDKSGKTSVNLAFHLYSMKQAIEEGFILDVLTNYIEYKTYYEISKTIEKNPMYKTNAAKREIARFVSLDDTNIGQRVCIIIEHFRTTVVSELGGQAKAMVVTSGREEAVRYRQAFEDYVARHKYDDVKALVAFSGKVSIKDPQTGDVTEYTESGMNGISEEKLPETFDAGDYNVLLVANKYQVGFDQPKLCAMYVLKRLRSVNAVQTLSRLNRPCPPFDKKVVVLDFMNTCEEMVKAFAPYYTATVLSNTFNIVQLQELEAKLDGYNVLDERDIDTVGTLCYTPTATGKISARDNVKIQKLIQRAITVLKRQYGEEQQKEFIAVCRGFLRLYGFMSLASSFQDSDLHKKYIFVGMLLTHLITGNSGGIDLRDTIAATNFIQKDMGDKGRKGNQPSSPFVKLAGAEVSLTEDEEKHLSDIIAEVNARAGREFDADVMAKAILQVKDLLLKSDSLKSSAVANEDEGKFALSYYSHTDEALLDGLEQNKDFFTLLLNNDDIKQKVLGVFLTDVYRQLRSKNESEE